MFDQLSKINGVFDIVKSLSDDAIPRFLRTAGDLYEATSLKEKVALTVKLAQIVAEGSDTPIDDISLRVFDKLLDTSVADWTLDMVEKGIEKGKGLFNLQSFDEETAQEIKAAEVDFETQGIPWVSVLMAIDLIVTVVVQISKYNRD